MLLKGPTQNTAWEIKSSIVSVATASITKFKGSDNDAFSELGTWERERESQINSLFQKDLKFRIISSNNKQPDTQLTGSKLCW